MPLPTYKQNSQSKRVHTLRHPELNPEEKRKEEQEADAEPPQGPLPGQEGQHREEEGGGVNRFSD